MNTMTETSDLALANVPVADIRPSPTNPRKTFAEAGLAELSESIVQHGVAQPILIRPIVGDPLGCLYEIVCGERRYRATLLAKLASIPAIVRTLDDAEALAIQVIENLQREDLHPLEEARGFRQLLDSGMSADSIAVSVGKSKATIYASLKLCDLCPAVTTMFEAGKFDASIALLIARIPLAELQTKAATEIAQTNWGVRAAKDHIERGYTTNLQKAGWQLNDTKLHPDAGSCKACPKRAGNNKILFADVGANVCTDPTCFAEKRRLHMTTITAKAAENNQRVITGAAAKALMPYTWTTDLEGGEYIDCDKACIRVGTELLSPRGVLGKELPTPCILINPHDGATVLYVIHRETLAPFISQKGLTMPPQPSTSNADAAAKEREMMARLKAERTARQYIFSTIGAAAEKTDDSAVLLQHDNFQALARMLWHKMDRTVRPLVMLKQGWPATWLDWQHRDEIPDAMAAMTPDQTQRLIFTMLMADQCYVNSYNIDGAPDQLNAAAIRFGFDVGTLRAEAKPRPKAAKGKANKAAPVAGAEKEGA